MSKETERRKNPFLDDRFSRSKSIACGSVATSSSNHATDVNIYQPDQNDDDDNLASDSMTASYSEISFHSNYPAAGGGAIVPQPPAQTAAEVREENSNYYEEKLSDNDDDDGDATYPGGSGKNRYKGPERPASLVCDKSFPYNLEGIVSKEGDMTNFVTENLEYKIKLSSPVTKKEAHQQPGGSSKNSTPSGLIPRQFMIPHHPPEIDSNVLNDIEIEAQYLAASVDNLTENLCNLLHSISSITADNVEIHKNTVNKLTDSMDANIKSMYTIMAKTEEISKSMKPTEQLATRIREIKRLVDMLEGTL